MQLTVSGVKKEYEEGITLPKLFEIENVETPEYVTVSINEEFEYFIYRNPAKHFN